MEPAVAQNTYTYRTLTILHVEDCATTRIFIKSVLENIPGCNFFIHSTTTLAAAKAAIAQVDFDVILLDLSLPDSQGLETLACLHSIVPSKPIVLLTSNDDEDMIIQGIRHGAQDYVPKHDVKPELIKRIIFAAIDRKAVEDALKISEERFDLAVKGSSVGLWDWDIKSNQLYWSERFKNIIGVTDKDFIPDFTFFKNRLHPDDHDDVMQALDAHLEQGNEYDIEYRLRHEEGHYIWIHTRGQAIWNDDKQATRMAGSVDNITDKKQAEKEKLEMELQLRQGQKLEAIGQLAAGIAHEINTPTQFVGDNIRFLQNTFVDIESLLVIYRKLLDKVNNDQPLGSLPEDISALIDDIDLDYLLEEIPNAAQQSLDGIAHIGAIVKAMKEFSHPGNTEKELVDINKAIESTLTVSKSEWKYVADIEKQFDPELPMVECLPGELNQVILNMIVNAAHAISDVNTDDQSKGLMTITTKKLDDDCQITISDTGIGMPNEVCEKIYDPFFTTKEVGKGTGQGLTIAYSVIVDKHQGTIDVKSEVGKGTTFVIRIPIIATTGSIK